MTEATTVQVGGAERAVRPAAAGQGSGRRLKWRHLWIVPGLAIAIVANELGKTNGVGILMLIAFGIAPDLPRLFGIKRPRTGLASVALQAFNVLHHPAVPAAAVLATAVLVTVTGAIPTIWLVASLVWLSHVIIGFGVGDVRRHRPSTEPANA
jgi:hypothetical protein